MDNEPLLNYVLLIGLSGCYTMGEVEKAFVNFGITDFKTKKEYLTGIMNMECEGTHTPVLFSDEDTYLHELQIFLKGSWRTLSSWQTLHRKITS